MANQQTSMTCDLMSSQTDTLMTTGTIQDYQIQVLETSASDSKIQIRLSGNLTIGNAADIYQELITRHVAFRETVILIKDVLDLDLCMAQVLYFMKIGNQHKQKITYLWPESSPWQRLLAKCGLDF